LSKEDPNPWLLSLPQDQQDGIANKRAVVGMSYDALSAAIGFPDTISRTVRAGVTHEVGVWGAVTVEIDDNVVSAVRATPKQPAPAATTSATTTSSTTTSSTTTSAAPAATPG
ncbi:MAG TPA: hypothetical protein VGO62_03265, partial [Myxococcota bacterium]